MYSTCSSDQYKTLKHLHIILGVIEAVIHMKSYAPLSFWVKNAKNNKSLGRNLNNPSLPNKKWFPMMSNGNDNVLRGDEKIYF